MMFAQANTEHCRHKIFNADFIIDGQRQPKTLFEMIRRSTAASPRGVLSAYRDNAAVIAGPGTSFFAPHYQSRVYAFQREPAGILMKVETHNHPTAISPYPGAATGSGGEIRDEGATGRGAKPKAGLTGFSVSNLHLPGALRPWEQDFGRPAHMASALDIMLEGPLGGAAFNNEFGRPNLAGYFRTFAMAVPGPDGTELRGYHKPIMIAGGLGNIRLPQVKKGRSAPGRRLVVLGGPAMLIGLGGGAASSMASGSSIGTWTLPPSSATMRRCSGAARRLSIAAGRHGRGQSHPLHPRRRRGRARQRPTRAGARTAAAAPASSYAPFRATSPACRRSKLWCNEAQERYVLGSPLTVSPSSRSFARRERCPFAVLGSATATATWCDRRRFDNAHRPSARMLFGKPPKMDRDVRALGRPRRSIFQGIAIAKPSCGSCAFPRWPRNPSSSPSATARHRLVLPRPDGRAVAGAGGRCGRHATAYDT